MHRSWFWHHCIRFCLTVERVTSWTTCFCTKRREDFILRCLIEITILEGSNKLWALEKEIQLFSLNTFITRIQKVSKNRFTLQTYLTMWTERIAIHEWSVKLQTPEAKSYIVAVMNVAPWPADSLNYMHLCGRIEQLSTNEDFFCKSLSWLDAFEYKKMMHRAAC